MTRDASPHLAAYLEGSAARFPERTAVVNPDGSTLSYRELNDRANRVCAFLRHCGVQRGDRVGLVLPKTIHTVTAIFGILKAGAAYVPADWSSPPERIRTIHSDCQVRAVFCDYRVTPAVVDEAGKTTAATVVLVGGDPRDAIPGAVAWRSVLDFDPAPQPATLRQPHDLAYILYTSGSTGVPKGVMLSHENATSFVDWCTEVFHPDENDRFSSHAPFHFDLSVLDIYLAIKHGAALFLISDEVGKDPKALAKFISQNRLSMWYSTPSILSLLAEFGHLERFDFSSLRVVNFAGEVFPVKHLRNLVAKWPHPDYYNLYGPTETNVCTFAKIPTPIPEDRTQPYPIGWPCSHCRDLVMNLDGVPAASGEEGLLYISGPSVFQGYWNRPKENTAAFMIRDGVRWYNTGDVVYLDPKVGYIYVGRKDRMVKRRGYRIELGEVESALYKHPLIREVAAVSISDESGVKIVVFLTCKGADRPSVIELKSFCNRNLPNYMIPDQFLFLDALPRTSTDKVNYPALTDRLREERRGT